MDGDSQYCHKTWEEFEELTEAEKKLMQKQIEHQLKETADQTIKRRGNIHNPIDDNWGRFLGFHNLRLENPRGT